jgi:hypothetical protein
MQSLDLDLPQYLNRLDLHNVRVPKSRDATTPLVRLFDLPAIFQSMTQSESSVDVMFVAQLKYGFLADLRSNHISSSDGFAGHRVKPGQGRAVVTTAGCETHHLLTVMNYGCHGRVK